MKTVHRLVTLKMITLTVLLTWGSARADAVFSLVVGENQPRDSRTVPLKYADDDAILFHKILSSLGPSVLLVSPDQNTLRLQGKGLSARAPTRQNLERATSEIHDKMQLARQAGKKPVFYFIYSGHGDVKNNEGYLALSDGELSAGDLSKKILAPSPALTNHVIVDACKSYYLVHEKRAGGERKRIERPFHAPRDLTRRFPNTGWLLSTSSAASSHEWEEFQAGIFSHEVRSGLIGAADADQDGKVSYQEIWAFIQVANSAIPNDRFRPHIFVSPPAGDGSRALLDVARSGTSSLSFPGKVSGRYFLEDAQGVRLADLHTSGATPVVLRLPIMDRMYLHDLKHDKEYLINPDAGRQRLAALPGRASSYRPKGAAHEAFTRIFEHPFTLEAYNLQMECFQPKPEAKAGQCPSYACQYCKCEGCHHLGAQTAPAAPPAPTVTRQTVAQPAGGATDEIFSLQFGLSLILHDMRLTSDRQNSSGYNTGLYSALDLDGELYPLGLFTQRWPADLGLHLRYTTSLGLVMKLLDARTRTMYSIDSIFLSTTMETWELGLRYRLSLGSAVWAPELKVGVDFGGHDFVIDPPADMQELHELGVNLPDLHHRFIKLRFGELTWNFINHPRIQVGALASFDLYLVYSTRAPYNEEIGTGSGSSIGFKPEGGFIVGGRYWFFKWTGFYQRLDTTFDLNNLSPVYVDSRPAEITEEFGGMSIIGGGRY